MFNQFRLNHEQYLMFNVFIFKLNKKIEII
jgi:hypothetical protein